MCLTSNLYLQDSSPNSFMLLSKTIERKDQNERKFAISSQIACFSILTISMSLCHRRDTFVQLWCLWILHIMRFNEILFWNTIHSESQTEYFHSLWHLNTIYVDTESSFSNQHPIRHSSSAKTKTKFVQLKDTNCGCQRTRYNNMHLLTST